MLLTPARRLHRRVVPTSLYPLLPRLRHLTTAPTPPSGIPLAEAKAMLSPQIARIVVRASAAAIVVTTGVVLCTGLAMEMLQEAQAPPPPGAFLAVQDGKATLSVHYQRTEGSDEGTKDKDKEDVLVLLDGGVGATSFDWASVMAACTTTAVAVDRPGLGYSVNAHGRKPRTAEHIAVEYAEMLKTLVDDGTGRRKQVVLVGHGAGGYNMRRLAELVEEKKETFEVEVVGLVLVDALQEDFDNEAGKIAPAVQKAMSDLKSNSRALTFLANFGLVRVFIARQHERNATKYPESALRYIESFAGTPRHCQGVWEEREALAQTEDQFRVRKPRVTCPTVVLSHGKADIFAALQARCDIDPAAMDAVEQKWQHAQRQLAKTLGRVSAVQMVIPDAGHNIHLEKPETIVQVVNALVQEAKNPGDAKGIMGLDGTCPI